VTYLLTEQGAVGRETLADYVERGGYAGLRQAREQGAAWVVQQMRQAGLRGRGGSGEGRPAADKWARVARGAGAAHYVIANGAESSPVSRKDRHLMALFPHRVLEGLLIACVACGASEGYVYVRGDSAEAIAGVTAAVAEAREAGLLGDVSVHVQTAIPSLTAGEETAVIDALEGMEGLPQPKPPRPEEMGLRGCPTAVTNVETLVAAAAVLRVGAEAFRQVGTADCPGTVLFTVSGDVARPGVYEVAYGTRLSALLTLAGAPDQVLTVLPGGLSSGPLRPDELDVALTYEDLAAVGSSMGQAATVVFGPGGSMASLVAENARLLAEASCGQCRGCKEGASTLADALGAGQHELAAQYAQNLLYGRGNCAHPTGAARFALRALQAFPEAWKAPC
jgi:NADH-quinone oxidoreductase subunit F